MIRRPPRSPLFPYPPLFRSAVGQLRIVGDHRAAVAPSAEVLGRVEGEATNRAEGPDPPAPVERAVGLGGVLQDRKSTRLNSSHANISYAVFCLKKKTTRTKT